MIVHGIGMRGPVPCPVFGKVNFYIGIVRKLQRTDDDKTALDP
jgi:hypothetical protein